VTRIVAVDWSGRATREEDYVWVAEVEDGELVELDAPGGRIGAVARLLRLGESHERVVAGLDFAFSVPRWYAEDELAAASARDVWERMAERAERILEECAPPFWGRTGKRRPADERPQLRRTEAEVGGFRPKSIFQIGGAGAVGTASLRGMKHLTELAQAYSIWPFDPPGSRTAIEIYPRVLSGAVKKSRRADRAAYLDRHFPRPDPVLRERTVGSEDAFDAAVSALVMDRHRDELQQLRRAPAESDYRLEGQIWTPSSDVGR
jgi:hypothetical protein